jgi:hypothetical protein
MVKTALIVGSKFKPALPSDFYTDLYRDRRPSGNTLVWLAGTPYDGQHQSDFRPIITQPDDSSPSPEPNSFSALVSVGQMVGFVVAWLGSPSTTRLIRDFGPALVPIWPPTQPAATWPPRDGRLDFAQLDALADTIVSMADVLAGRGRPNV